MSSSIRARPRTGVAVHGFAEPRFAAVVDAFEENFRARDEVGAAFAVAQNGRIVVDLWAGLSDRASRRRWDRNTLVTIFSQTKAWVAVCLLRLVDRGTLALNAPVARYWPEFAAHGKDSVLVRDVLTHTSRLPTLVEPASRGDLTRPREMARRLARQPLDSDPRAARLYHGLTFGWLCDELIRRVDGRSVGAFLREEIAEPLALDLWIGLPARLEPRMATLEYAAGWRVADADRIPQDDLLRRYWTNPVLYPPRAVIWNDPPLRRAEIPAINGAGSPRSIARLYDLLLSPGAGAEVVSRPTLDAALTSTVRGRDPFSGAATAFASGFQRQSETCLFGPVDDAFGHAGMGGSIHGAWPRHGVGFSYAPNRLGDQLVDPRAMALTTALAMALDG